MVVDYSLHHTAVILQETSRHIESKGNILECRSLNHILVSIVLSVTQPMPAASAKP